MLAGTLQFSIRAIEENLLFNMINMMVANDFSGSDVYTCEHIFNAVMDEERATEICSTNSYNFSDPDTVAFFVRGPWYNNANQSSIM